MSEPSESGRRGAQSEYIHQLAHWVCAFAWPLTPFALCAVHSSQKELKAPDGWNTFKWKMKLESQNENVHCNFYVLWPAKKRQRACRAPFMLFMQARQADIVVAAPTTQKIIHVPLQHKAKRGGGGEGELNWAERKGSPNEQANNKTKTRIANKRKIKK